MERQESCDQKQSRERQKWKVHKFGQKAGKLDNWNFQMLCKLELMWILGGSVERKFSSNSLPDFQLQLFKIFHFDFVHVSCTK